MHWIGKLLKKPAAQPAAARGPAPSGAPIDDPGALRADLAGAAAGERGRLAERLGRALAGRSQAPLDEDPPEVWVAAVCHASDQALALAWSAHLQDEARLGEVALKARSAEVRFACARRIEATGVLEQVARASRDRDKRVHRHCTERLRQRRQVETNARRAQEIAAELQGLLGEVPLSENPVLDLKKELAALVEGGEDRVEYRALLERAQARLQQEAEARRGLNALRGETAKLAAECAHAAWPWDQRLAGWRTLCEIFRRSLADLPPWLAGQAQARAIAASLTGIESRLAAMEADSERTLACERFLARLEAESPADADRTAWAALAKPDCLPARQPLEARWRALLARLPAATPERPGPQPVPDPGLVRGLLDRLEQAIGDGRLADADAAAKQIRNALAGHHLHGALETRLHALHTQLEQMRGWAKWGTGQAREQLIAAARALLEGERGVDELARAIPALREQWKRLDAHGAAGKGQWEAFDTALEKAYLPVAARQAETAARQAEARAAKEALCAGWEAEVAGIAWEHADFRAIESRRAQLLEQWRTAPHAGHREERKLRKRLDRLIADIDRHLDAARTAERERRERLIAAAEALGGLPDLRRAMAEAKTLQGRWSGEARPVRLRRGDEQELWQRFRAARNAVFERQEALRAERTARQQERAQSRQRLLDDLAAVLAGTDSQAIRQALTRFRAGWDAGRPSARETADGLEARAKALQQEAQRRLDELRRAKQRERFDLMARKAALAGRVEAAALAAGPIEEVIAGAKRAWDALPPLPGRTEGLLARRLAGADRVTHADLERGRAAREALLLDLEIALGLPSPESCAAARRERQLARLQDRFGSPADPTAEPEEMLVRYHATAAPPDASAAERIEAVVRRLVDQTNPGK